MHESKTMGNQREERQRKKDFLDSYHNLMLRAKAKRIMLDQFRADYSSLQGIDYEQSGLPRSRGYASDLSGLWARIDEHRRELDATLQQAERVYRLVKRELDALDDPKGACIISMRHFARQSWKEITSEIGLASESQTREIYTKSLDRLEIPEEYKTGGK